MTIEFPIEEIARLRMEGKREQALAGLRALSGVDALQVPWKAVQIANELLALHEYDEAGRIYDLALERKPDHAGALRGKQRLSRRRGSFEKAKAHTQEHDARAYREIARAAEKEQDWGKALTCWEECRARFPNNASALAGLANANVNALHIDRAALLFSELVARHPDKPQGYEGLSRLAERHGDWAMVISHSNSLIERWPGNPKPYLRKLAALIELDHIEEFEHLWSSTLDRFPDCTGLEALRVRLSRRPAWRPLADASPPLVSAQFDFTQANEYIMGCIVLSRWEEAETALRFALDRMKRHPWFLRAYGEVLLRNNRPEEALPLWEEAYSLYPSGVGVIAGFARCLLLLNLRERARSLFAGALKANPGSAVLRGLKSRVLNEPPDTVSVIASETGAVAEAPHHWLHSGDLGDLVYALPSIREGGGGRLFLVCSHQTSAPMSRGQMAFITPLLERQPYIHEIRSWEGEDIDRDFTDFRLSASTRVNLAYAQAEDVIPRGVPDLTQAWIAAPESAKHGRPVFARSRRYRNMEWNGLWEVLKAAAPDALFVGTSAEYAEFGHGEHFFAENALDLAQVIAGASVFVGNQSLPFAIAEGLKVKRVLEVCPRIANCSFPGAFCVDSLSSDSSGPHGGMAEKVLALLSK